MHRVSRAIYVRGVVQGVGFRPFVFRLAQERGLAGWVLNEESGVEIHIEGADGEIAEFIHQLTAQAPPAARISGIEVEACEPNGAQGFAIRASERSSRPTVGISPDLPVCDDCLREMRDPNARRYHYPYINCTNCGPRYSVIERLPYDRANTTMKQWPMDHLCQTQYADPGDRRFHAQPIACPSCGPVYVPEIASIVPRLASGGIVAVKGIGGYHLVCDAANPSAVLALRERKFRKEKPFAVMVRDISVARGLAFLDEADEALLSSPARPIVLLTKRRELAEVAPDSPDIGLMLPYAPLHFLLFDAGVPEALVMTSGNRSSEPIAYRDDDALARLTGIADAFLIGERPIARSVEDSVVRLTVHGPQILRRSRGYAPSSVATLAAPRPVLALGADLKNTITLVTAGQAFMSQYIGDLDDVESRRAFRKTVQDLTSMYEVHWDGMTVVHDLHPQYSSTLYAREVRAFQTRAVQHHRAHIASVLAERADPDQRVIGVSFDGTGYGDDGAIWGGEFFVGGLRQGLERVAHLRAASLPGGDAAARHPVQCAAGFVSQLTRASSLLEEPFCFPPRYLQVLEMLQRGLRVFPTTSMGRLFDAAAALVGFTREVTYEGQAAIWLENLARGSRACDAYPFPWLDRELDYRPLLEALMDDRKAGRAPEDIAGAFHRGVAQGCLRAIEELQETYGTRTVVLSGGVFQNTLLLNELSCLHPWVNHAVPPNDGGISLGQAALAIYQQE